MRPKNKQKNNKYRKCTKCKIKKHFSKFRKDFSYCRLCVNKYQKEWRQNNLNKTHKYARMGQLRRQYNFTLLDYDNLIKQQCFKCAICGNTKSGDNSRYFHIDHCHINNRVRGLLCGLCNKGLGCFHDNDKLLISAINYLNNPPYKESNY